MPPLKVALAGLTMIQQSLLEFYFETREGKKQYIQVLPKDADAYITNFDESGSAEAWNNLYGHEKKPTLVLSHQHKTTDNYIYIPKPITPIALENAVISLNELLHKKSITSSSDDFLSFSIDHQSNSIAPHKNEESIAIPAITTVDKPDNIAKDLDELISFEEQEVSRQHESFDKLAILDDLNLQDEKVDDTVLAFEDITNIEDITTDTPTFKEVPENNAFDEISILSTDNNSEEIISNNETPSDDLDALLRELSEEDAKQKKQTSLEEKTQKNQNTAVKQNTKEESRWDILCGQYDDISYKINSDEETYFKLTDTLLPYLKDTINFSKRADCWMKISYKYLTVIIDPENKCIYSSISLEDRNFTYLCTKNIDEDQVELEEIDEQYITQIKQKNINTKHFNYSFEAFLWTTSLIVSHGRLPDHVNPDNRISINNWLSLKEVEKFPHIMQIAAVFNQHTASLNEVAKWMNLPKRYVYAFYNGVEALDLIEQSSEKSNKEGLITMMKDEKESMLKKLLFTKIM
ncbi:MAG: hypothetical protein DSZ29_06300 [Aquificaceae bacterium]|nr:MAG: hypothetical protein DSZ29_06300 [Aquificaceae bacterium]